VRGGNRQRLVSAPGASVPSPPRNLDETQRRLWRELARAVEELGTFADSDLVAFRALVRAVGRAESLPLDAPPSAAARLEQVAASALAGFGLSPAARERLKVRPLRPSPPHDPLSEFE
jgi:phage terminase small subunit